MTANPAVSPAVADWVLREAQALWAAGGRLKWECAMTFAAAAEMTLRAGSLYAAEVARGAHPADVAAMLKQPEVLLKRAAALAPAYQGIEREDYLNIAYLAIIRGRLRLRTMKRAVRSLPAVLRLLGPKSAFARTLAEWRWLQASGEPPTVQLVELRLANHWNRQMDGTSVPELARELAAAFRADQLTVAEAEGMIGKHLGQVLDAALVMQLAKEATEQAQRNRRSKAADVGTQTTPAGSGLPGQQDASELLKA